MGTPSPDTLRTGKWDDSYRQGDNIVFAPHEEVVRFVSKYIRKRIGLDQMTDVIAPTANQRLLDLGCGIGRHVIFGHQMGLEAYGIDLSAVAVDIARTWAARERIPDPAQRVQQGDVRALPWPDGFFGLVISHGVLDSMPYDVARAACVDLARVMAPGALFYCDLVSGDDSAHAPGFAGEETVETAHEHGTVQLYFNAPLIDRLREGLFELVECVLITRADTLRGGRTSRYHLVLRKP